MWSLAWPWVPACVKPGMCFSSSERNRSILRAPRPRPEAGLKMTKTRRSSALRDLASGGMAQTGTFFGGLLKEWGVPR